MADLTTVAASGAQQGRVSVVLGAQWGDEGKGAYLSSADAGHVWLS